VNRGTTAEPIPGQPLPYTRLYYLTTNGALSLRHQWDGSTLRSRYFWWDGADRLRKVTTANDPNSTAVFTAKYNSDGLRVNKTEDRSGSTVNHDFTWSPFGLLHDSHETTFYTPGFGHRANGVDRYYQSDWLGSTRYVTDSSGTAVAGLFFDAFGNRAASDPVGAHPTDLMYAGGWGYQTEWSSATEAGLGLQYLHHRYYDPALSRFISPDPIGIAGGLNLYGYSGNNPVTQVDPHGLEFTDLEGQGMILHYMFGRGEALNLPNLGTYMMKSDVLAGHVAARLGDGIREMYGMSIGSSQWFSFVDSVKINTNDGWFENRDGYTLLNGSESSVGGFQLLFEVTRKARNEYEFVGECVWNDIMDPNPKHKSDSFWAGVANFFSMGQATEYLIRIPWTFRARYGPGVPAEEMGWPFQPVQ
jgi:RHS repeat-associated protein